MCSDHKLSKRPSMNWDKPTGKSENWSLRIEMCIQDRQLTDYMCTGTVVICEKEQWWYVDRNSGDMWTGTVVICEQEQWWYVDRNSGDMWTGTMVICGQEQWWYVDRNSSEKVRRTLRGTEPSVWKETEFNNVKLTKFGGSHIKCNKNEGRKGI